MGRSPREIRYDAERACSADPRRPRRSGTGHRLCDRRQGRAEREGGRRFSLRCDAADRLSRCAHARSVAPSCAVPLFPALPDRSRDFRSARFYVPAQMIELSPDEWVAVRLSLRIALVATVVALPFGLAVAWLLARKHFYGKALLDGLIHLPLVLPAVVTGYLPLLSFGRRGPIGAFPGDLFGLVLSFRWAGAAPAWGVMGFPLLVRPLRLAIEAIDRKVQEAAGPPGPAACGG